ncbi:chorismate mutase [Shewanella marina]|uniref:chorismate mutase n=1 Tax=Shewanella marina TaxID=487319 RepID=UPI0009FCE78B|nr:chorismate mutase [Shewanella marina]
MKKPQPLNITREQITALDDSLLELLAKRKLLSLEVARSKEVDIRPIRDTLREKQLLSRLVEQGRSQGLDPHFVTSLYQSIIEDSVLHQQAFLHGRANPELQKQQYCVAYLGARGSYSYLAANRYCLRRQVEMLDLGCRNFDEVVHAVEAGHADYGFLPIENTSSGSINEVYDVLQHTNLAIIGETTIEVGHCLLAKTGINIAEIETIYAHPQPLTQCSRFLSQHPNIKLEYCASSADAMEKVATSQLTNVAAIGSQEGGALYQLESLQNNLANQDINQSRFIVVARKAVDVPTQLPAKTTLIMATGQKPGALVNALLILKSQQLNMSKLESRPIPGTPWEEMFYLDIDANIKSVEMQTAIQQLEKITRFIKVLGCYPCETVKPTQLSQQQLLIEPDTSKSDTPSPVQNHKMQINCKHLQLGQQQTNQLYRVSPVNESSLLPQLTQLQQQGAQAIICRQPEANEFTWQQVKTACDQLGLVLIVEINDLQQLEQAQSSADMLYICAEQMYNRVLLNAIGQIYKPVIVPRHKNASIDELIAAVNTVQQQGNQQIILADNQISILTDHHLPLLLESGQLQPQQLTLVDGIIHN